MALKDFFKDLDNEVSTVLDSSFEIEIIDTKFVPNFDDPSITFDNLDTKKKKCKRLESCVLYVDIRNSVKLSAEKQPKTLAKVYSSFVRTMIACARYYGGHVRNIIGDRVMVVFDQDDCFKKSIDTATLMNSVCKYILNKRIKSTDFKCGIGIDYGKMLITKGGAIRQGAEKEFYRSLVWLGKPANIASRLTDLANKTEFSQTPAIHQGNYYPYIKDWHWQSKPYEQFIDDLESTSSRMLKHKDGHFYTFFKTTISHSKSYSPILITKAVFDGLKRDCPQSPYIDKNLFSKKDVSVRDYYGDVYGGDAFFPEVKDI
ncbi:adenylate/guanylate cyclase domain-containing protein [Pseudocolwellia agarivorans]|uniref:adenylate/guanylate cyclase domain-containing protein n=1 Tax=Pseudocolwellia agarivorans TaxID=1911682 RepID=UPI00158AA68E|nr:adenylate/guanylate cyclase domain-containing protein [Pseudocolwellia agarivorans]